jgi:hypothetical protein
MRRLGFEPTIPVFERAKIFHPLDRAATGICTFPFLLYLIPISFVLPLELKTKYLRPSAIQMNHVGLRIKIHTSYRINYHISELCNDWYRMGCSFLRARKNCTFLPSGNADSQRINSLHGCAVNKTRGAQ